MGNIPKSFSLFILVSLFTTACNHATSPGTGTEVTPHTTLPRPFSKSTYFLYGDNLRNGELPVLINLGRRGFLLHDAWVPDSLGSCMGPTVAQLVVELQTPDSSIYKFGFTSDSSRIGYCVLAWKQYHYY